MAAWTSGIARRSSSRDAGPVGASSSNKNSTVLRDDLDSSAELAGNERAGAAMSRGGWDSGSAGTVSTAGLSPPIEIAAAAGTTLTGAAGVAASTGAGPARVGAQPLPGRARSVARAEAASPELSMLAAVGAQGWRRKGGGGRTPPGAAIGEGALGTPTLG